MPVIESNLRLLSKTIEKVKHDMDRVRFVQDDYWITLSCDLKLNEVANEKEFEIS